MRVQSSTLPVKSRIRFTADFTEVVGNTIFAGAAFNSRADFLKEVLAFGYPNAAQAGAASSAGFGGATSPNPGMTDLSLAETLPNGAAMAIGSIAFVPVGYVTTPRVLTTIDTCTDDSPGAQIIAPDAMTGSFVFNLMLRMIAAAYRPVLNVGGRANGNKMTFPNIQFLSAGAGIWDGHTAGVTGSPLLVPEGVLIGQKGAASTVSVSFLLARQEAAPPYQTASGVQVGLGAEIRAGLGIALATAQPAAALAVVANLDVDVYLLGERGWKAAA